MFQFSGLPSLAGYYVFNIVGSPIRTSMDHRSFASPHSFSQLTTSFIVSTSLGIPRTPFFASFFLLFLLSLLSLLPLLLSLSFIFTPALSMNFFSPQSSVSCFYTFNLLPLTFSIFSISISIYF